MKIRRLVLGRTINTGNYESVRCDIEIELDDSDSPLNVRDDLEEQVDEWETQLRIKYGKK